MANNRDCMRLLGATFLALCGLAQGEQSAKADAPTSAEVAQQWLDRMALAVSELNYKGTLVYVRGDAHLEAVKIYHQVKGGIARERLVSLSGPHREVLRDEEGVRCVFEDKQAVIVDARITEPWFPVIPPEQAAQAEGRYEFRLGHAERIAGLSGRRLEILPKDGYRYGHRLWLEEETGMLLKSELLDENHRPVEQLMFIDLAIGVRVSDADLAPDVSSSGFVEVTFPSSERAAAPKGDGAWLVDHLPAGFVLTEYRHASGASAMLEHLLFSDGLASVSVYVEPVEKAERPLNGPGRLGPINMYGVLNGGFAVTAVGEVPSTTVRLIASSLRRRP